MAHTDRIWSDVALELAERELMEAPHYSWRERISAALNVAIRQAEREDADLRNQRLQDKIVELGE